MNVSRPGFDFTGADAPSVGDVQNLLRASTDPDVARRLPQLITSLNRLSRFSGRVTAGIPFTVVEIRRVLASTDARAFGLSPRSLANDRSNLDFVFAHLELGGLRSLRADLSEECRAFYELLEDGHERWPLSRLLRFISARHLCLRDVDEVLLAAFEEALEANAVAKDPRSLVRNAANAWNRAAARCPELELRQLKLQSRRNIWGLKRSDFPASFGEDVDRYFARLNETEIDVFDLEAPTRSLRPVTIREQTSWFFLLASAAVHGGVSAATLTSITELVRYPVFEKAVRWLFDHYSGAAPFMRNLADMGRKAAKHYAGLDPEEAAKVAKLVYNLRAKGRKLPVGERRLQRLRPLQEHRNVQKLLALSLHVRREVEACVRRRGRWTRADALLIRNALLHELALVTSFRRRNLLMLNLDRHVRLRPDGGFQHIEIPGEEVKNSDPLVRELTPLAADLLALYLKRARPMLQQGVNAWLFPGEDGHHLGLIAGAQKYSRFVKRFTGLDVNLHLIRSLGDKLYMERNPEGAEVMRIQLGHRSEATRRKSYADPLGRGANRKYVSLIVDEQEQAHARLKELFR